MSTIESSLDAASSIEGVFAVALVDIESGMTLGSRGGDPDFDLDVAAPGNSDVVRTELDVMKRLGIRESIEDVLITLDHQYHLIRPLRGRRREGLLLYAAFDRWQANLGTARRDLRLIADRLQVEDPTALRMCGTPRADCR